MLDRCPAARYALITLTAYTLWAAGPVPVRGFNRSTTATCRTSARTTASLRHECGRRPRGLPVGHHQAAVPHG